MKPLPASPDLSHLKKQAKELLRDARAGQTSALERFVTGLPAARGIGLAALAHLELRLHDAQSVIAREYGFLSWTELKRFVEWKQTDRAERLKSWLKWVYDGHPRERRLAVRMLREEPELFGADAIRDREDDRGYAPWLACAAGNAATLASLLTDNPGWAKRAGGPLGMPPLVAVTHSLLISEPGFEAGLLECARLLLAHGADVNGSWVNREWGESPLSALYGASGRTHNVAMTQLLLSSGASPDDNESLYHSVEGPDSTCTRLLLEAGARVTGTNAIGRVLDYDKLDDLKRMLEAGGNAAESPWIHHAILRGRSLEHIQVLVDAGADLRAVNHDGTSLYRWAGLHGRADMLELLRRAGVEEPLTEADEFVAAATRGDLAAAQAIEQRNPGILGRLSSRQLKVLPELADVGNLEAVRTMVALGWPLEVKAAWQATALNLAVYRGDTVMATLLLEHGARWETPHGFKNNVMGTLSHSSQEDPEDPSAPRDYVGCARTLIEHGMPLPPEDYVYSSEVTEYFDSVRLQKR